LRLHLENNFNNNTESRSLIKFRLFFGQKGLFPHTNHPNFWEIRM
jgi:hypothetical protein